MRQTFSLDSADGGTGAAPQGLMDNVGLPVASSLPYINQRLIDARLRSRVKLIATGKMVNLAGVAAALCLGADAHFRPRIHVRTWLYSSTAVP